MAYRLDEHTLELQADAARGFIARGGSLQTWLRSKDFTGSDRAAIVARLRTEKPKRLTPLGPPSSDLSSRCGSRLENDTSAWPRPADQPLDPPRLLRTRQGEEMRPAPWMPQRTNGSLKKGKQHENT